MKFRTGIVSCATVLVATSTAYARDYSGSDTLERFTKELVTACGAIGGGATYPALAGATPQFNYIGGGSTGGGNGLRNGTQDIAPQSRAMNQAEYCEAVIEAGPEGEAAVTLTPGANAENWAIGRDGLSITTRAANALRCDNGSVAGTLSGISDADGDELTADDFGASLAFNKTINLIGGGTYTFADWREVLRVLWAGADLTNFPGTAQTAANREARCNSVIRRSLVDNWDDMIQNAGSCAAVANSCQNASGVGQPLRHIYRRDDLSGTTDTFLTLLGLNAVGGTLAAGTLGVNEPFCNGRDTEDRDPIRVRCTNANPANTENDETCGADQTKGLVVAIRAVTGLGTNNTLTLPGNRQPPALEDLYPSQPSAPVNCAQGVFAVRPPPAAYGSPPFSACVPPIGTPGQACCPDGAPFFGTGCLTPQAPAGTNITYHNEQGGVIATAAADCNCVNHWSNNSGLGPDLNPSIVGVQNDGRVWNGIFRGPRSPWRTPPNPCPALRDERGTQPLLADMRMRYRTHTVNGTVVPNTPGDPLTENDRICHEFDATRAIGCLSRVSDCSLGFAGREAGADLPDDGGPSAGSEFNGATPLMIGNIATPPVKAIGPDETAIFATTNPDRYPLGRKLYFNSIVGVDNIRAGGGQDEQDQLITCMMDPVNSAPLETALELSGFLPANQGDPAPFIDESVALTCP
jgi:hypothetical protein